MADESIRALKVHETRARITAAALDLFVRDGYAQTSIDQAALATGISRRTVFRCLPRSKRCCSTTSSVDVKRRCNAYESDRP